MKKLFWFFFLCVAPTAGFAENPMFSASENQIGLYTGISTGGHNIYHLVPGTWWGFQPFSSIILQYGKPMEFFGLPARYSIHFGAFWGFGEHGGEDWRDYSQLAAGLSMDTALLRVRRFYFGVGLGGFEKSKVDARQDSRFVFQLKLFAGYRMSDKWSLELFTQHFSNGNLTPVNSSYNFAGLALLTNF